MNRPTSHGNSVVQRLATLTALTAAVGVMFLTTLLPAQAQSASEESDLTPLFNGTDLSGWYGWSTRDPQELWAMSAEERAEYKRKSVEGDCSMPMENPVRTTSTRIGESRTRNWSTMAMVCI
ncbi:MAG: hypothetical protein R3C56_14310 [Pirellulaceae bacterium]